jgi:farnesyl diphosphate synthase
MVSTIPATIAAASYFYLWSSGSLEVFNDGFFQLPMTTQLSLLAILFSIVFLAVDISNFIDPYARNHSHHHHDEPPQTISYPIAEIAKADNDMDKFLAVYPMLRDEMLEHMAEQNEMPKEAIDWCRTMMDYNVPGGKLNRGVTVVAVHRTLVRANANRELTDTEVARASVLGWAIEFLQAFFLVADDVMDASETRRGQPCWYKLPHVKNIAINDSFLLESYVFTMLKRHFGKEEYYMDLLELFLQVIQKTEFGQLLDLTSQEEGSDKGIDLTRFTLERYQKIVKYKTAFYTFYLPVAIGMITSRVQEKEAFDLARDICCQMGEYFQIQDDYLDCYGDPKVIGKVGTDIQDNKCSWLVIQALDRVTPEQRKVLEDNYGQWDDAKVANVKALYNELNLVKVFEDYEERSYQSIQESLDKVTLMPRDVFELLLKKIYKRSK